jgi:hypothetical protein
MLKVEKHFNEALGEGFHIIGHQERGVVFVVFW